MKYYQISRYTSCDGEFFELYQVDEFGSILSDKLASSSHREIAVALCEHASKSQELPDLTLPHNQKF